MKGYGLLDTYSGEWLFTDMHIDSVSKGENVSGFRNFSFKGRETTELRLATAKTPTAKTTQRQGDDTIEERLAKLKELLDKGLLTPDEAAAKRKEILNAL